MSYAHPLTVKDIIMDEDRARLEARLGANTNQVGGSHYAAKAIQPWDFIIANNIGYLEGNIIKYLSRWKDKGGIEDLKKAQHYLQKLIETHDKERVV
jgi:hypothetical protein